MPSSRWVWILVLAGIAVRLINLTAPPIGMHSWRQSDTAAIARNFYENGYRFGWPEVDWGGSGLGYVESEFPLYPFTVAVSYGAIGGVQEWAGRLLSLLGFVLGALALFRLVRRTIDEPTALWSTGPFLFLPLGVFYSRAFMPEGWMIAASIAGVYFFHRWTESEHPSHLLLSGTFLALAALLKLPALYLGLPIAWMAWSKYGGSVVRRPELWATAAVVLVAVAAWYWHAHQIARTSGLTFGIWEYGSDKWGNWGLVASWEFWNALVFRSLAERWFTWAGFPLVIVGLVLPRRAQAERLFDWWLLAVLVYCIIVARGNFVHEYYQLPFLPVGAVFMGKVFARFWGQGARPTARIALTGCLIATAILSAARLTDYLRREAPSRSWEANLAEQITARTKPTDRIVTVTGGNPTLLYMSHRKGWVVGAAELSMDSLRELQRRGAKFLAGRDPMVASGILQAGDSALVTVLHEGQSGFLLHLERVLVSPSLGGRSGLAP